MIDTPFGSIHTVEEMIHMESQARLRRRTWRGRLALSMRIVWALVRLPTASKLSIALSFLEER